MELRLGVIGAGHMGARHVRVSHSLGVLAAVFDSDPSKRSVAEQYGAPFYDEFLTFDGDLDAVIVATPPGTHYPLAMEAIDRGISVLVEKPLTLDPSLGAEIVRAADKAGVSLAVGHVERFNPAYRELRRRVSSPDFVLTDRASPKPQRDLGPAMFDVGVHDIDLAMDLFGSRPRAMCAAMSGDGELCILRLRFANGEAAVRFNRASEMKVREMTVSEGGNVLCADLMNKCLYVAGEVIRFEGAMEPIEAEIRDFLASLAHQAPTVGGHHGLLAVTIAHMAENGKGCGWMDIPAGPHGLG